MPRALVLAIVSLAIAAVAVYRAIEDWRFQLAGLADPFLGRPSPGVTMIIGALISIVILGGALLRSRPRARVTKSIVVLPVLAFWGAYGLGAAMTVIGGGRSTYPGTLTYNFGPVIDHRVTVQADCHTPVGKPFVLSDVRPSIGQATGAIGGLPMLRLRHEATGASGRPDGMAEPVAFGLGDQPLPPYPVPGMTDRPRPYLVVTSDDGTPRSDPPIDFLRAYDYRVSSIDDVGMSGTATLHAERWTDPFGAGGGLRWVDLVIADDPWPMSFDLSVAWICDSATAGGRPHGPPMLGLGSDAAARSPAFRVQS
jgi:hypothetical protein